MCSKHLSSSLLLRPRQPFLLPLKDFNILLVIHLPVFPFLATVDPRASRLTPTLVVPVHCLPLPLASTSLSALPLSCHLKALADRDIGSHQYGSASSLPAGFFFDTTGKPKSLVSFYACPIYSLSFFTSLSFFDILWRGYSIPYKHLSSPRLVHAVLWHSWLSRAV
eukprot:SAG11_NODE_1646_length_4523_cov_1.447559_1_plen_166_part_00